MENSLSLNPYCGATSSSKAGKSEMFFSAIIVSPLVSLTEKQSRSTSVGSVCGKAVKLLIC